MSVCVDCGHSFEAHGPTGCTVILINIRQATETVCACREPGLQSSLFGEPE